MNIPITQSKAWAQLQDDLGEKYFFRQADGYQYLAILKQTPAGNYLYCPYGPAAEDGASFKRAIKSLHALASGQRAIFIRVEPTDAKMVNHLPDTAKKSQDLNPKETWILDLSGSEAELKDKLPSRLLRYYKSATKKGITIEKSHRSEDIKYLLDLQRALAKEKGINTFSEHYLQTELKQPFATLYLVKLKNGTWTGDAPGGGPPLSVREVGEEKARQDPPRGYSAVPAEKIVAAGLVFDDNTTRYNLQGAQSDEGRKLHATGILTIQLILDAHAQGQKLFDFWGVAPEGAPSTHPWAGFTNFKKTFAGYQENHAGTYDIVLKPAKYKLYQTTRKLNRLLRK
ncbi:peptidoglycan bridge formation glycyltransferase FemA/FemB family protein [Candidatus Saccharibacteria bacterium]|nr:peptidoglycan bridge formation glycyltransferase FemA/FemB family protein [Candidatus Saccharibacteria bacterium]